MISWVKEWIINICAALFFITAAEIVLPDNSLKKFARFVLGLILLIVIINPIISLFKKNLNITALLNKQEKVVSDASSNNDAKEYTKNNVNSTLANFQNNLQKVCEEKLKSHYKKMTFKAEVKAEYDDKKNKFSISQIKIGYSDNSVKGIKKINIHNDKSENESTPDENMKEAINELIYNDLGVSDEKIVVYKM